MELYHYSKLINYPGVMELIYIKYNIKHNDLKLRIISIVDVSFVFYCKVWESLHGVSDNWWFYYASRCLTYSLESIFLVQNLGVIAEMYGIYFFL